MKKINIMYYIIKKIPQIFYKTGGIYKGTSGY